MEIYNDIREVPKAETGSALTIGKFEGVHLGHQRIFKRLAEYAEQNGLTSAVLSFLNDPKDIVGNPDHIERMIYPLEDRIIFVKDCGIDRIVYVPFNDTVSQISAADFIKEIMAETMKARFLICGKDFRFGREREGDIDLLRKSCPEYGCTVSIEDDMVLDGERVSSSAIVKNIIKGDFEKASQMLGREYFLEGEIHKGHGIGTQLGFPTINIHYPDTVLVPAGVLAGRVEINGRMYPAAVNSGRRPTVHDKSRNVVEIHVLEQLELESVGKVKLYPLLKIRDEHKFDSLEELKDRIGEDCRQIRKILGVTVDGCPYGEKKE